MGRSLGGEKSTMRMHFIPVCQVLCENFPHVRCVTCMSRHYYADVFQCVKLKNTGKQYYIIVLKEDNSVTNIKT